MPLSQHKTAPVNMGGSVWVSPYVLGMPLQLLVDIRLAPVKMGGSVLYKGQSYVLGMSLRFIILVDISGGIVLGMPLQLLVNIRLPL